MKNYTVERRAVTRELITFKEINRKGEKIAVEFTNGTPEDVKDDVIIYVLY